MSPLHANYTASPHGSWRDAPAIGYAVAFGSVALTTGLLEPLHRLQGVVNVSMLYLLVVFLTAVRFGRGPALLAAFTSYLALDWVFISPQTFSLITPRNLNEWLSLTMFILTAYLTGQITAELRAREAEATQREREAAALADASWAVVSRLDSAAAFSELLQRLVSTAGLKLAAIIDIKEPGSWRIAASPPTAAPSPADPEFRAGLDLMLSADQPVGWPPTGIPRTPTTGQLETAYLPLRLEREVLGALYLRWPSGHLLTVEQIRVVDALASHAALVLQRDRLIRVETHAQALQEADRLKTALLQMVSHDFRSPLTSIKAGLSSLRREDEPEDGPQNELIAAMDLETDRLIRMVHNVLALSQLEAGACRPQCELISVTELVGAALDTFSDEENERIRLEFDPNVGDAWLDEVQIVQVLHNLIENALKYSPPPHPVELRVSRAGDRLQFEVLDHGPGLPEGEEDSIFERFYRGRGLKESAVRGLGLGLALSRGLVEAHNGELLAVNRAGGGTDFTVSLPARPERKHDEVEPAHSGH